MPEQNSRFDPSELSALERARIVTLAEGSRLSSLSEDTIKREHPDKLVRLSPRRLGIRVGDCLFLSEKSA
jgi:hypothetical protein